MNELAFVIGLVTLVAAGCLIVAMIALTLNFYPVQMLLKQLKKWMDSRG